MADSLTLFYPNFTDRNAPRRGPMSADKWNDSMDELAADLSFLSTQWNTKIATILNSLPYGSKDTSINAFKKGLDGANLWVDATVSSLSTDQTFYNVSLARPSTVKEAILAARTFIQTQIDLVRSDFIANTAGLSTGQKSAIGSNIFDSTLLSSASSLDGKSTNNQSNISQLAEDLYGTGAYTLDNDGSGNLTNSVAAMVGALLNLHGGSWSAGASVDHILDHDVKITDNTKGLILRSPNGNYWRLEVDNAGALSASAA